ncbi:phage portal protein [Sinosporangium album]|uniref:phage portal protein n=1 Tax=Sinosporangium album TaxID=504805 RepID=UPI001C40A1EF|nr:phage portal protein [Sinosporangium album]
MAYLDSKLSGQKGKAKKYADYYDSKNTNLQYAQVRFQEAFGAMFQGWQVNFCGLIIDSISERIRVEGFRMSSDPSADRNAWQIWQRNSMDADGNACHIDALALGSAYATVWADADGQPTITPESASEVYVQYQPGSRRKVMSALKRYRDDWGTEYATLWTPQKVYTSTALSRTGNIGATRLRWSEADAAPNPLGVVPVVPLYNRTRLRPDPFSELEPIVPLADAISKIAADALIASEFAAFPQRYIAGLEIEEDDQGNPKSPFKIAIDRLLMAEDANTVFGQFEAADLGNYVRLIDAYIASLAAISRIPFHYFLIGRGGQPPSGEAITSAEAGLVAKARERMLHFGESWETVMRLCFKVLGDKRADAHDAEIIWGDPQYRNQAALIDSAVKLANGLDVPRLQLYSDVGYSPQQIERFDELREMDFELARRRAELARENAEKLQVDNSEPGQQGLSNAA